LRRGGVDTNRVAGRRGASLVGGCPGDLY
jgi:hypothetical protein